VAWRLATCFVVLALACRGLVGGGLVGGTDAEQQKTKKNSLLVQEWRRNSEAEDAAHAM
jgi:hypothetical protein